MHARTRSDASTSSSSGKAKGGNHNIRQPLQIVTVDGIYLEYSFDTVAGTAKLEKEHSLFETGSEEVIIPTQNYHMIGMHFTINHCIRNMCLVSMMIAVFLLRDKCG